MITCSLKPYKDIHRSQDMEHIHPNRRFRRSDECGTALRFQLESVQQQASINALALSDRQGLLIAWAGEDDLCEELGAMAPIVAQCPLGSLSVTGFDGQEVLVRSINYFGQPLYLASMGGDSGVERLITHSIAGIQRILTAN